MKTFHKSIVIFLFGATATAALIALAYLTYGDSVPPKPKRRRKPFTSRSATILNSQKATRDLSDRPCCVVAPISSPTKAETNNKRRHERSTVTDDSDRIAFPADHITSDSVDNTLLEETEQRDIGTPDTFSSYSSLESNDAHLSSSDSGTSACSESNSESSLPDKRKNKTSKTPMKALTEEEFSDLLSSPVVRPLHEDVRMPRGSDSRRSLAASSNIVQEYGPSVVDSCHEKIYGGYHDIVPSLQPYTKPIIFQTSESSLN